MKRNGLRRLGPTLTGLLALSLLAAACTSSHDKNTPTGTGNPSSPAAAAGTPKHGGTITIGVEAETPGWDPPNGLIAASGRIVNRLVYGALTQATTKGTYVPYEAQSVTPNADFTSWTIKLRPGMTFQDGSPFDAQAVKFSIDRVTNPKAAVAGVYPWMKSTVVVDPETVRINLKQPIATLPIYLAGGLGNIVSMKAVQSESEAQFNKAPVGAGPYKMTQWVQDDHVTLQRWPGFFDAKYQGFADTIIIKPIPDEASREAALKAGDVDAIVTQSPNTISDMQNADGFTETTIPYGINGMFVNTSVAPLNDLRIRQAIDYGMDKNALIKLVWKGIGKPADSWFPTDSQWYSPTPVSNYDPAKAKALVAAYKSATGKSPAFTIISPPNATYNNFNLAFKDMMSKVGIDVTIGTVTDADTEITDFITGKFMVASYVMPTFLDPDYEMSRWYTSTSFLNVNKFKSTQIDADLLKAQQTTDVATRKTAYADVQKIIQANAAGIFVRQNDYAVITKSDIHVTAMQPDGSSTALGEYFTPVLPDAMWRS